MQKEKFFELLGWIGMVTAILMYVFYFQQIQQNLSGGPKGNFLQPFMAGINCTFWVGYGFFKNATGLSLSPTYPVLYSVSWRHFPLCKPCSAW